MRYFQGKFNPRHPDKYRGDPTGICYRSGWELKLFSYLDRHPEVLWWQSEEVIVPYRSPIDNRIHRYFPDVIYKTVKETVMVEVKPHKQTMPPVLAEGKKMTAAHKRAAVTYAINQKKWQAARAYCADRKWKFIIMSERELGIK